jgi:hypothetical protein
LDDVAGGVMQTEVSENGAGLLPEGTLWVRFVFVDHAGIPKAKAVYKVGFAGRARAGVGLAKGVAGPERCPPSRVGAEPRRRVPPDPRPLHDHPLALRPRAGDGLLRHDRAGREYALGRMPA